MGRLTIFIASVVVCGALGVGSASGTAVSSSNAGVTSTPLPFPGSAGGDLWVADDDAHQHVFVSAGPGNSSIVVFDYAGNIVDTITGEPGASEMALDASTHTLYVALHDATAISAIDTDTLTETSRFSTAPYPGPYNLVLGGGKLWFACAAGSGQNCPTNNGGGVVSVNTDGTGLNPAIGGFFFMTMLAAGGPGNDLLAVANSYAGSGLATYDLTTDPPSQIMSNLSPQDVPGDVSDMNFDPSGSNLLLGQAQLSTYTLLPSFLYPNGGDTAQTTADGDFVAEGTSPSSGPNLFLFPVDDTTVVGTWTLDSYIAPHTLAFSPDRARLFVVSIDGATHALSFDVIANPAPDTPSVSGASADQSSSTAATLKGSVNPEGLATTYHFEYGTNTAYGTSTTTTSAGSGLAPVPVSAPISGLTPGTTYHFRLVATNPAGTSRTPDATFTAGAQSLTAITESTVAVDEGPGTGTITSSPAGIDCGAGDTACAATFTTGSSVTLTATPDSYSAFMGWGGNCSGKGSCTLTMSSARSVKAIFAPLKRLTVSEPGNGLGNVTSVPAGINCGLTCSATYAQGSSVTLTAAAGANSTFTGWSGACSGTGQCTVQMNADTSVNANFTGPYQRLTLTEEGGSGNVTSAPAGIDCGSACSALFPIGSSVTVTATADPGFAFTGWSGACTGVQSACTLTMDQARSVTATFAPEETLKVSRIGDGRGTVTSSPTGIKCGSTCAFAFVQNTFVTLIARPSRGSTFVGWSGACGGRGACGVQLVTSNAATARFRADCVVPELIGLRLGAARSRLQAAHCSLGTVKSVFSTRVGKGRVVSQRPHAHKARRRGAKVNLDVSRG